MPSLAKAVLLLAVLAVLALAAQAALQETTMAASSSDPPPRKVVVGTMMHAMYDNYPGLDGRLKELSGFIDSMAAEAERKYGRGLDLAVLPENAVTGGLDGEPAKMTFPLEGKVLDVMGAAARKHQTYIVVSMGLAEDPAKGIYTNAGVLLDRTGEPVGIYRKVHLVDSAPAGNLEGGLAPGKNFPVFDCDCKGAEIVVWPSQSPQTIQPRFRASQHGYYVVSSTWRNNASFFDPVGDLFAQTKRPSSVCVAELDLSYAIMGWQPTLGNGQALTERYGKRVGYRYSEAEDCGIFWSNDPKTPIMKMVRDMGLELMPDAIERSRRLQDQIRGGPPSRD
jgi:hypothetical protein